MIKQDFVRAFERGARRDHRTNIGPKTDTCEVIFDTEDSTILSLRRPKQNKLCAIGVFCQLCQRHAVCVILVHIYCVSSRKCMQIISAGDLR